VGGPIYSVSFKDNLLQPIEARGTGISSVSDEEFLLRRRNGGPRLKTSGTDVAFYNVEGVLNVAHQPPAKEFHAKNSQEENK
jgi:hypothetical protein